MQHSPKVRKLVSLLSRLPGVGEKTAQRYVLHLLTTDAEVARDLGAELATLHDELRPCERCGNIADVDARATTRDGSATICKDDRRDPTLLCVVGRVHDLHGDRAHRRDARALLRPRPPALAARGHRPRGSPACLASSRRIRDEGVTEVIVATPPSVDGEATALLLKRELAPAGVKMTRIASGVPHGGDLEYADPITMGRALAGRQSL